MMKWNQLFQNLRNGYTHKKKTQHVAFAKAQTALIEYQDYINTQNILQKNPANHQVHRDSVLKWKAYIKAYESLPEYQDLLAAQERLSLFASLKEDESSDCYQ